MLMVGMVFAAQKALLFSQRSDTPVRELLAIRGGSSDKTRTMNANALFEQALGLGSGWKVVDSKMDTDAKRLDLRLDFQPGSHFACSKCGTFCPLHDTVEKSWRHLDFWQHQTILTARVPRTKCEEHGVLQAQVPWAREGSGFTLMMEATILLLCQQMPVCEVASYLDEQDTRLWRIVSHHVNEAQKVRDWSEVRRIQIDETSAKRGHRYVTNVVDADTRELLLMVEGRTAETLEVFADELEAHGGTRSQIEFICMDMSPAYKKGARESFPEAKIVFDRFHIMLKAGEALDKVRKELQRSGEADLKGARWDILGNEENKSEEQLINRRIYCAKYPKLGRAVILRDLLKDILGDRNAIQLDWWCKRAMRSRLEPFKKLARMIRKHWDGIMGYFNSLLTNGLMEAINGVLQVAKRLARGFRSFANFRTIAYLKAAKLRINLPGFSPT